MRMVKGSEIRQFIFTFRLNIVLHDSYQEDEFVTEIDEWKQKVPSNYVKSFIWQSFIERVGGTNCILEELHHMNLKFDYS